LQVAGLQVTGLQVAGCRKLPSKKASGGFQSGIGKHKSSEDYFSSRFFEPLSLGG
jgi:hypothetical protein